MTSRHKMQKDVLDRLSKAEGHIRGIRKMVEEDRSCPDVLLQIAAVKAALDKVGRIVLEDHMESCLMDAVRDGDVEAKLAELKEALAKLL